MRDTCRIIRRYLVTHSTVNMQTGEETLGETKWEVGPCNAPLFSNEERKSGVCKACASGWSSPTNHPI